MLFELKTLTGNKYKLDSSNFNTGHDIKLYLQEKEGIAINQIRLISNGRQLSDTSLISSIILTNTQVIHMILALRGGM
jgi:ubiquitin-like protein Nedd8